MSYNCFTKIVVKVLDESQNKVRWLHLAYVDSDLYDRYTIEKEIIPADFNAIFSRWIKEDFHADVLMSRQSDILILKSLVKDFYKRACPELYINSNTDRQGWLRVWVTKKMKEDLNIYGEECF